MDETKNTRPFFSVIITCFNLQQYIADSIQSVLSQDLDQSFYETIVVDDASTDASLQVIHSFSDRIKIVSNPTNVGVLSTLCAAIRISSGRFICTLDGDDTWNPAKLTNLFDYITANPYVTFVTHSCCFTDAYGSQTRVNAPLPSHSNGGIRELSEMLKEDILSRRGFTWLGSAMTFANKPEVLNDFIKFSTSLPFPCYTYQDWPLAYWFASLECSLFGYIDKPLMNYRVHPSNHSGGSQTLAKARATWLKSYNTSLALYLISHLHKTPCKYQRITMSYLALHHIVSSCLSRGVRPPLSSLLVIPLLPLPLKLKVKELSRLSLISLFGPSACYRILSHLSIPNTNDSAFL